MTSAGSDIDQSATSIQILPKQSRSEFLMTSHVRSPIWTLRVAKDDLSNPHDFRERTYQGILQIMAFFPCKSSIISLIYDLVKVWYVLRWHQATTSAVRYGTTSALSRFLNSSFCHNSWNISTAVDNGQFKKELPYVMNTKKNCLELSWLHGPCVIRMSHWRHSMLDDAKFWIRILRKASHWQLIQI